MSELGSRENERAVSITDDEWVTACRRARMPGKSVPMPDDLRQRFAKDLRYGLNPSSPECAHNVHARLRGIRKTRRKTHREVTSVTGRADLLGSRSRRGQQLVSEGAHGFDLHCGRGGREVVDPEKE